MTLIIEPGKFYLKIKDDYVVDAVSYNPHLKHYNLFETNKLPTDIMNGCYQIQNNQLVLNQNKYEIFLQESDALEKEVI